MIFINGAISVKNHYISWLIIISLCLPSSMACGAGISVPTVAAAIVKALGSIVASYTAVDFMELVTEGKKFKAVTKVDSSLASSTIDCAAAQIKEVEQPLMPLILVGLAFFGVVALHIKINKQLQNMTKPDIQAIDAEKA